MVTGQSVILATFLIMPYPEPSVLGEHVLDLDPSVAPMRAKP